MISVFKSLLAGFAGAPIWFYLVLFAVAAALIISKIRTKMREF